MFYSLNQEPVHFFVFFPPLPGPSWLSLWFEPGPLSIIARATAGASLSVVMLIHCSFRSGYEAGSSGRLHHASPSAFNLRWLEPFAWFQRNIDVPAAILFDA
jgi:hypothetical protein